MLRKKLWEITWKLTPTPCRSNIHIASFEDAEKVFRDFSLCHDGKKWILNNWMAGFHNIYKGIFVIGNDSTYCEEHTEEVIVHEFLHDLLSRKFGSDVSVKLDNIHKWHVPKPDKILFKKVEEE